MNLPSPVPLCVPCGYRTNRGAKETLAVLSVKCREVYAVRTTGSAAAMSTEREASALCSPTEQYVPNKKRSSGAEPEDLETSGSKLKIKQSSGDASSLPTQRVPYQEETTFQALAQSNPARVQIQ